MISFKQIKRNDDSKTFHKESVYSLAGASAPPSGGHLNVLGGGGRAQIMLCVCVCVCVCVLGGVQV